MKRLIAQTLTKISRQGLEAAQALEPICFHAGMRYARACFSDIEPALRLEGQVSILVRM